jgi:hypothetical protein
MEDIRGAECNILKMLSPHKSILSGCGMVGIVDND